MTPEPPFTDAEREAAAAFVDTLSRYPFETTPTMREAAIALQCALNRRTSELQATLAREAATHVRHDAKLEDLELALHLAVTERGERMSSGTYIGNARRIIAKGGTTHG